MIDYLGGWADRRIAAGDAATEAGKDPRVGDRVRIGRRTWILHTIRHPFDEPNGPPIKIVAYPVDDAALHVTYTPEEWATACAERGYLVQRGGAP